MFAFRLPPLFSSSEVEDREVQLEPVTREKLSPVEFLQLLDSDKELIKSSRFISPRLGDDNFGYFDVEYERPVYK